mmetsp:Transcript_38999/g.94391  ORF Transcript_38999/g.94391 Transcript_38999/m.94391 type:complete len:487 (-) Transcript_38999:333-1793(-)
MANFIAAQTIKKVIEVTDVDGVVRRIDINDVVSRIDVQNVIERIDVNRVVERVDVNAAVQRIDVDAAVQQIEINKLLDKVDWNKTVMDKIDFDTILKKVDTSSIVLRSSTGAVDLFLDALRMHVVLLDLYLWVLTRGKIFTKKTRQMCYLPPRPGTGLRQREDRQLYPKGRSNKAVAVQGRYVGFVTKLLIMMIDMLTISILFAMLWRLVEWCLMLFLGQGQDEAHKRSQTYQSNVACVLVMYWVVYWFGYFFLCTWLTGQTLGMVAMGCKVVNCIEDDGRSKSSRNLRRYHRHTFIVSSYQSFIRTLILPVTLTICPPLLVMGLWRRDGRMLHDWFAGTGIIYSWDAKLAKMREKAQRDAEHSSSNDPTIDASKMPVELSFGTEGSDEFDEWIDGESGDDSDIGRDDNPRRNTDGTLFFSSRSGSSQGQEVLLGQELLLGSDHYRNNNNHQENKTVSLNQQQQHPDSDNSARTTSDYETFHSEGL